MKISCAEKEKKMPDGIVAVRLTEGKTTILAEHADGAQELRVGVGKREKITRRGFVLLPRRVIAAAKEHRLKKIALFFDDFIFPELEMTPVEIADILAHNAEMANYSFDRFKSARRAKPRGVEEVVMRGETGKPVQDALRRGQIIGSEVNSCRDLANTPGGDMTPALLAKKAREAVRGLGVRTTVLGKREMQKLGMGAVLGVSQGSAEEPQFIIMEYRGGAKTEKPLVFVGKGVTFDTGGLNLKTEQSISEMHMDMSGGAAVIHSLALAAKLAVKKNIVGLIPAVENMPSGASYRPGDILRSLSGKTIEVINTDAEGRLILADALTYAERYKPRLVVDVATLTGASLVALGTAASALMTPDTAVQEKLIALGEESGEYLWPFPLWDEYRENVRGQFADLANLPVNGNTRYAGVINGGMFLREFAAKYPWAHIDMAPRMTAVKGDYLAKGAAGSPVRLLLAIAEKF